MQIKTNLKEDLKKKIYLVSYNLSGKTDNKDKLIAELKKYPGWCKLWDGQWFVCSSDNADAICQNLKKVLNSADWLFVSNVNADRMGLMSGNVVEWLNGISKKIG